MAGKPDVSSLETFAYIWWATRDRTPCGGEQFWNDYHLIGDTQAENLFKGLLERMPLAEVRKVAQAAAHAAGTPSFWFATCGVARDPAFIAAMKLRLEDPGFHPLTYRPSRRALRTRKALVSNLERDA